MSRTRSELPSTNHGVFRSRGPHSEEGIASSIVNMMAGKRDRTFEIWEGDSIIRLTFEKSVLSASEQGARAKFWLDRIVGFLQHPIHHQFFADPSEPVTVQVVRGSQPESVTLLVQREQVR